MGLFAVGTVVSLPFPFSDLSSSKVRPALILAQASPEDRILCQISSHAYRDPQAVELGKNAFASGGLQVTSYARPGKLFTAHQSLVLREEGRLKDEVLAAVQKQVIRLFQSAAR